jgi:hypothetical protein
MGNAMGEGVGLSRAGAGNHQQGGCGNAVRGPDAMLDGAPLLRIEGIEIGGSRWHVESVPRISDHDP